jgi:hypothetical protein
VLYQFWHWKCATELDKTLSILIQSRCSEFDVLTAVLLRIVVLREVSLCCWASRSVMISSSESSRLLALLYPEDEDTVILQNIRTTWKLLNITSQRNWISCTEFLRQHSH